jgi:hypothetical protein
MAVEFATERFRAGSVFPESWGVPPANTEARHRWILEHAREEARKAPARELERKDIAFLNWLRLRELESRRVGP